LLAFGVIPYRGEGAGPRKPPKIDGTAAVPVGVPLALPCACPLTVAVNIRAAYSDVAMFLCDRNSTTDGPKHRQLAISDQKAAARHHAVGDVPLPEGINEDDDVDSFGSKLLR
jgi:hypothetical protein